MNVLIIEDERKTADLLRELVESHGGFLVVQILDSIEGAVDFLTRHQGNIDLLFLDIHLADGHAFRIFDQVDIDLPVIFCTAYDDYILQAFKTNGIDYILKPFEEADIAAALDKFSRMKSAMSKGMSISPETLRTLTPEKRPPQKSFLVQFKDKMIPVAVERIALLHLDNELVRVFCFDGKVYSIIRRMDDLQAALDAGQFFRINRQMIVNRDVVREIEPFFNRKVIIQPTIPFPEKAIVSRLKVSDFLKWMENPH